MLTAAQKACGGYDYAQALCKSMNFYMAQAGGNNAIGQDWRGSCFKADGQMLGRNLSLGWFDAGDYVKFHLPMAYSANHLAWGALEYIDAYKQEPMRSGLLYNLRMFAFYALEAWNPTTKTLVVQVGNGDADHATWKACKYRTGEARPTYSISPSKPGTEPAADTASALASIALVLQKLEGSASSALQTQLATAAVQLYSFAETYKGSYDVSVPAAKAFYASYSGYNDELALGATWLASLKAAGLITTSVDYVAKAKTYIGYPWNHDWDNKHLGAAVRLVSLGATGYGARVLSRLQEYQTSSTITPGGLLWLAQWGTLRYAANSAFIMRLAVKYKIATGTQATSLEKFAKKQMDYILGSNPKSYSYIAGFGTSYPRNPHHRSAHDATAPGYSISTPTLNKWTLEGAMVGGPAANDAYADDRSDYTTSEVTTDYNALLSGLLASYVGSNCKVSSVAASASFLRVLGDVEMGAPPTAAPLAVEETAPGTTAPATSPAVTTTAAKLPGFVVPLVGAVAVAALLVGGIIAGRGVLARRRDASDYAEFGVHELDEATERGLPHSTV
jgi:hypothetical protein